ncbi:hypothetical protein [Caballeronia glebae]|uniref:hypothetical protein n=1 Tax=Caballeronia glebae TaxID=1777143 RepID=UPI00135A71CC|nr:hypothetical protein [Caballeronia glebae]
MKLKRRVREDMRVRQLRRRAAIRRRRKKERNRTKGEREGTRKNIRTLHGVKGRWLAR